MISLDKTTEGGAIRVVERPQDLLPRLGQLEGDEAFLTEQLMRLDPNQLRWLADLTEGALARMDENSGQIRHARHAPRRQRISRASSFGD